MNKIHINKPEVKSDYFRVLPKRCRKFARRKYHNFNVALHDGMKKFPQGFRIFRQYTYDWYEPLNIEVAKIAEKKKWGKL